MTRWIGQPKPEIPETKEEPKALPAPSAPSPGGKDLFAERAARESAREKARREEEEERQTLRDLAIKHTEKAIQALVDVLDAEKAGHMAKITAAIAILDRGHGKPTQYVEQTTKVMTYQSLLNNIAQKEEAYVEIVDAQAVKQIASIEGEQEAPQAIPTEQTLSIEDFF